MGPECEKVLTQEQGRYIQETEKKSRAAETTGKCHPSDPRSYIWSQLIALSEQDDH